MSEKLRQIVWHALDMEMLDGAEFAAERLLALDPSNSDCKHLYGLVLYRQRRYKAACNATNNTNHVGCAYIFARSCLQLKNYEEGIEALEQTRNLWTSSSSSFSSSSDMNNSIDSHSIERVIVPDYTSINTLLGRLYEKTNDRQRAIKAYGHATRTNPYLWESVEALCAMGVNLIADNIFKSSNVVNSDPFTGPPSVGISSKGGSGGSHSNAASNNNISNNQLRPPYAFKTAQQFVKYGSKMKEEDKIISTPTAPSMGSDFSTPTETKSSSESNVPVAPSKRTARTNINSFVNDTTTAMNPLASSASALTFSSSSSLSSSSSSSRPTTTSNNKNNGHGVVTSVPSARRPMRAAVSKRNGVFKSSSQLPQLFGQSVSSNSDKPILSDSTKLSTTNDDISNIYNIITTGCVHLYSYRCRKAIECFKSLPRKQISTPYILSKLGRAAFEMVEYKEAEGYFSKLRQQDRTRIQDMEYYSTLLWHLRKENELSYLARELLSIDKESFQSWCALGNSFSLHKEPENALKCFQRAIYLNPESPYPYTLQAHEYVASEALESAQSSFRLAIRASNRHYNAWYGLGMVFMRYGDLDKAYYHFSHALSINSVNMVLLCCLGMVLEKKGRLSEAYDQYKQACEIKPNSPVSRYKKVRAMIHLKLYDAALVEFEVLKRLAPDEASVHFLLGQLYKLLDKRESAIKHFTVALNLDPKGSHFIKDALESVSER